MSIHAIALDSIGWVVLIEKSKCLKCFWNEIENGFEIKEKKEKKILKIRVFLKFILGSLTKLSIFIWIGKYIWNYTWVWFEFGLDLEIRKKGI